MRLIIIFFIISLSIFAKEEMVTLQSKVDGKNYILKIDQMKVDVNIIGNIAETSLDIIFKNDLNKQIEGTLYLPLKENANIFEYQFEVNKIMKKGVVVEKEKARIAYEEITRRRVDPGLLIWSKGNNFKTRVYPINAKSTKRIIVSYQEELTPNLNKDCKGKCPSYYYDLPLNIKYKLSKFSMKINGNGSQVSPIMKTNRFIYDKLGKLVLIDENYTPNENIKLAVFNQNALDRKPIINISYNPSKKNYYFAATVFPKKEVIEKDKPEKICIYWDSSMSMSSRNIQKEIDFIKEYLKYLGRSNVSLIGFSNTQEILGKYISNAGESPENLLNKIKNSIYDGGTQLGVINTQKTPNNCKEALIFSDVP